MMWIRRNGQNHLNLVKRGSRTIVSAEQYKELLTDDSVKLRILTNKPLDIDINDSLEVFGETYRINDEPSVVKFSEREYEYTVIGQGLMFDMLRCVFFNADGNGWKSETSFPIVGDLRFFVTVVANNMQRFSTKWKVGHFPEKTETKTLAFNDDNCLSAMQKICAEYSVDFWIKKNGDDIEINVGDYGVEVPVPFSYGKGRGLYKLTRRRADEESIINRLYVFGGEQNIPYGYRNFSTRLKFSDDSVIEDEEVIKQIGLRETVVNIDDIYPHRTGVITAVNGLTSFVDSKMDFDLNERDGNGTKYLVPGQKAKIHMNSGNLAGYEFEITKYDSWKREFTIIPFSNENGQVFPSADSAAFQFAVGDEYVLTDIFMPESYISNSELDLKERAIEEFDKLRRAKVAYELEVDSKFIKRLQKVPEIGDFLKIKDDALGIDRSLKINRITREFIVNGDRDDYNYKIVVNDERESPLKGSFVLEQMQQQIREIKDKYKNYEMRIEWAEGGDYAKTGTDEHINIKIVKHPEGKYKEIFFLRNEESVYWEQSDVFVVQVKEGENRLKLGVKTDSGTYYSNELAYSLGDLKGGSLPGNTGVQGGNMEIVSVNYFEGSGNYIGLRWWLNVKGNTDAKVIRRLWSLDANAVKKATVKMEVDGKKIPNLILGSGMVTHVGEYDTEEQLNEITVEDVITLPAGQHEITANLTMVPMVYSRYAEVGASVEIDGLIVSPDLVVINNPSD